MFLARLSTLFLAYSVVAAVNCFPGIVGYRKIEKSQPKIVAHVIEFDPNEFSPQIVLGGGSSIGLETVHSMANRTQAIAAFNGGFYRTGLALGSSLGLLSVKKEIISLCESNKAALGWSSKEKKSLIDQLTSIIQLYIGSYQIIIKDLNSELKPKSTVLYSHHFSRTTLTPPGTKEYLLSSDKKIKYLGMQGNSEIPKGSYILSISPDSIAIPENLLTSSYYLNIEITPQIEKELKGIWRNFDYIIQVGPLLVKNKKKTIGSNNEKISDDIGKNMKKARTAVGIKDNGNWVVAVIEALSNSGSVGMDLDELSSFMLSLGSKEAINFDGGGSSTLIYNGQRHFSPSNIHFPFENKNIIYLPKEGDRPVGNGIVILKKG